MQLFDASLQVGKPLRGELEATLSTTELVSCACAVAFCAVALPVCIKSRCFGEVEPAYTAREVLRCGERIAHRSVPCPRRFEETPDLAAALFERLELAERSVECISCCVPGQ